VSAGTGAEARARHAQGLESLRQGRIDAAVAELEEALRLEPSSAEYAKSLGNAYKADGNLGAAIASYRSALSAAPDYIPALYNLGVVLLESGRHAEAEAHFRRVHELDPRDPDALGQLALLLHEQSRFSEATPFLRAALSLAPDNALYLWYLGVARARAHDLEEGRACLEKALQLEPGLHDARFHLGNVYSLLGWREEAVRCYEAAHDARPDDAVFAAALLFEMQHVCDWSRLEELCARVRRAVGRHPEQPFPPFNLLAIGSTRAEQLQCARNFAQAQERAVAGDRERLKLGFRPPASARRVRLGYLSSDFHGHATAYLMAELFELHDRGRFEVHAYSYGIDDGSATRARLRRAFDRFVDIGQLSHADAASAIHADGIDILVDLKGYTYGARPEIPALRPAPVQVSFIGYPGTSGSQFIDYLVADRFVVPAGQEAEYSEALALLPGCYQVNDRNRPVGEAPARAALGIPEDAFVFCCFNQPYKILPEVFAVWMRLLQAQPRGVLWLLDWNPGATRRLRGEAQKSGVEPGRLVFGAKLPPVEHLGRARVADLFLDTFPCGAHTTASDALWVGLPVLTCAGDTFVSRVAGSLLASLGVPELATRSLREYEALAMRLARNPGELAALREKLVRNRAKAALFDTPRFARSLEEAYLKMWELHCAGASPRSFAVPADGASS
jgi:predicted O-linked N-acetylglucosamine transferase (SPINDLY family)